MAAIIADQDMRMAWFSSEFERLFGEGVVEGWHGLHYAEFSLSKEFLAKSSQRSVQRSGLDLLPMLIDHTPGGREGMRNILTSMLGAEAAAIVDQVAERQDPLWMTSVKFTPGEGMAPVNTTGLTAEIHDREGRFIGAAAVFFAPLPFRLVSFLARGDEAALERMARLTKPGRHSAAILFADLQSSGVLSRRLPSAVYFSLVRALVTAIDRVVIDHQGVVGRHAGDGATSFFLTDDLGSPSSSARAAIGAAREIRKVVQDVAAGFEGETNGLISAKGCPMNVGIHWGSSLYMGQLVTDGRLEVTALGDAVNECARIQETARDGQILASKAVLENLGSSDAAALDVDPDALSYSSIAEIPTASEKAIRDAGGIAVASL
ncbi:MAG: adenylate/guanylate cyclase domain-containing protein [Actinomycetota bacterium]